MTLCSFWRFKALLNKKSHSPNTPSLKLIVTRITFPVDANMEPSYGFPEFHSYDSPCMYTIVALLVPSGSTESPEIITIFG